MVNDEVRLGASVGCGLFTIRVEGRARRSLFHKKLVIAYHADYFAITVNTVLPKHFLVSDTPGTANLITDIFYKIQV